MAKYCLKIETSASSLSLYFNTVCSTKIKHRDTSEIEAQLLLTSLDFTKRVYEPCHIKASINITISGNVMPDIHDIKDYFAGSTKYKLSVEESGAADGNLIDNCFAYKVTPVYPKSDDKTSLTVDLDIYSCDFLLTLRKYSASYVAKKFAAEVIPDGIKKFANLADSDKFALTLEVDRMQFLHFLGGENGDELRELIQPYLVQYNESFYDFIVRTARRCGEFLYFEDGKLKIGLKSKNQEDVQRITNYESLSYDYLYDNTGSEGETGVYNNYMDSDRSTGCSSTFPYNSEIATDEHHYSIEKGEYEGFWDALWMYDFIESIIYGVTVSAGW